MNVPPQEREEGFCDTMPLLYTWQERLASTGVPCSCWRNTPNSMDNHLIDATETHLGAVCILVQVDQPLYLGVCLLEQPYTPSLAMPITGV